MTDARNILVGERVRFYRTSKGLSLVKMASAFPYRVSGNQLAKYETGQSRWPADMLCEVAVILKVDIRLLTGMEDGKHEGKNTAEWEAERYKCILLALHDRARKALFKIIDIVATLPIVEE